MRTIGLDADAKGAERERYQRYLCGREWSVLKEAVRERCGGICERCRVYPMDHVHHLTYARKYREQLEDLQAICEGCHEFTHGKRDRDPILDAPVALCGRQIGRVYLAGRISRGEGEWRKEIVPDWFVGVRGAGQAFGVGAVACDDDSAVLPDGRSIAYSGPYWLDILGGHGGGIGPHAFGDDYDEADWGHGVSIGEAGGAISNPTAVAHYCRDCLMRADLVFAWLDSRNCLGTLVEIGWASTAGKIVAVAVPKWDRELWLACATANRFVIADTAGKAWEWLWKHPDLTHKLGAIRDECTLYEGDR